MATVLLFHHALGLTEGIDHLAQRLRDAGHDVTTPDLYDGRTYSSLEEGVGHAAEVGFERFPDLGDQASLDVPADAVVGISLGVLPAQKIAATRPGVKAAVLVSAGIPVDTFGTWPGTVALQAHVDPDDDVLDPGEADVAVANAAEVADGEAYTYPGAGHLFVDDSVPAYDAEATDLLVERVLTLLGRI